MADNTFVVELVCGTETGIHLHAMNMPLQATVSLSRLLNFSKEPFAEFIERTSHALTFNCINGKWLYHLHEKNPLFFTATLIEGNPLCNTP